MAMILGVNFGNSLLGFILGNTTPAGAGAVPATYYCALYTVLPTGVGAGGGGTEVSGGAYARPAVVNNPANFPAPTAQEIVNATAITFPTATVDWGTILAVGFFDALTLGNFKFAVTLATPVPIYAGSPFIIQPGFLTAADAGI